MTPTQCKMARAGLNLSVHELAEMSGVSANTISSFERGKGAQTRTADALKAALLSTNRVRFEGEQCVCVEDE